MSDAQKGKYDIDELVKSLLLERQSDLPDLPDETDAEETEELSPLLELDETEEVEAEATEEEPIVSPVTEAKKDAPKEEEEPQEEPAAEPTPPVKVETTAPAPKKRRRLFARKMDDTASIEQSWSDYGVQPIGSSRRGESLDAPADVTEPTTEEDVCVTPPKKNETVDEFPAVRATAETITMQVVLPSGAAIPRGDEHTRVIPQAADEADEVAAPAPVADTPVPPADDQLPDQISLEEMVRVEDIETDGDEPTDDQDDMDPEERLHRNREERVRVFTLDEEEEENEPEEEAVEAEPEIEDFTGYQDTQTVAEELKYRCRSSLLSLIFTSVITLALLILTLLTWALEQPLISPLAYVLTHLFGLVLMMGLNYSTITHGLSGLFSLRANNDTAPATATAVCLGQVIVHLLNTEAALPYWTPLVGLLLVFSAIAHHSQEVCVRRNFSFVSYPADKYAAAVIEEENALQEIGRRAVSNGDATVAYFRRTDFLSDYLANAYDEDCGDDWSRFLTPATLILSVILSALSLMGEHVNDFWSWLAVFTGMVCLSMPVTMLAVQVPLTACCRRILARGGFINGWQAVRQFGQPDALAVDMADLYPDESMLLHGLKTFSDTHIDEAILTAASLVIRAGGPLSMIFRRIIENKEELLYEVDSLVYEQGMGLSGWVDGRRVFVGNGRLLQNHGVDVPSSDYEARYAKDGRRLVYLSIAGQLSAMFVVSYLPDPEIQSVLQHLCRSRVTLLVRSCDPNITASDLCDSFELDEYYVDVLPAAAGRLYMQLTEKSVESLPAVMASNGHILGTARVLSACRGLQVKTTLALITQTIAALAGLILCLLWAMNGMLSPIQPLLLMLITWLLTWLIPLFKRA